MLDPCLLKDLNEVLGADQPVALVVEWLEPPNLAALESISSRKERLVAVRDAYRHIKGPISAQLEQLGVQVQDLYGGPQAIIRADSAILRPLLEPGGMLERDLSVKVISGKERFEAY